MTTRRSELALVLVCVNIDGVPHLLFHRHRKWGDWSLIGGHVEPGEEKDWLLTAIREADEELTPLRHNVDFVIEQFPSMNQVEWGPVPSRAKGNVPTIYAVRYYWLRFVAEPVASLARLNPRDFVLVRLSDLQTAHTSITVSNTFERFAWALGPQLDVLPCAWPTSIHRDTLPSHLDRLVQSGARSPGPRRVASN